MIEEWVEWGLNEINGCCLFIRDSSRLFHSDPILTSFLCHSINIYIRSCPEWYWNERMIEEWIKWGLNEINGCCLFIRDSSRLFHSDLILTSFPCHSINIYIRSCSEWLWNDRMMVEWQVFQNPIFCWPKKSPSFLIIRSFLAHLGITRNEKHNGNISFNNHSFHLNLIRSSLVIQEWCWNDGMRWDEGRFFN